MIQLRVEKEEEEGRGEETRILIYRRGVSIIISPSLSAIRGQDRVPGLSAPFRLPWSYRVRIYFALCPSGAPLNGRVFRLCPPRLIQPTRRVAATDTTTHALSVCLPIADRPRGALHRQIVALRWLRSQRSVTVPRIVSRSIAPLVFYLPSLLIGVFLWDSRKYYPFTEYRRRYYRKLP